MTRFIPLAGYLVVERQEEASKTPSGIVLAESAKEKPQRGKVIAVGKGKEGKEPQVQVGQIVLFKKYGPTEVTMDGKELLLLEEEDLLAIVE